MSEPQSAVDVLRAEVLSGLPDARVEEDFAEIQRAMDLLEAERLRRLADIEHRGVFSRDGYLSVTAWLANVHRQGWGRSRASVQTARALEQMPHTTRALGSGDISMAAARTLVEAREVDAEAFPRAEEQLVEAARIHLDR